MNKRLVIIAVLIFFSSMAHSEGEKVTAELVCPRIGLLAENIMEARQSGLKLTQIMQIMEDSQMTEDVKHWIRNLVLLAWEEQQWLTESSKKRAIHEFREKYVLECYRQFWGND